MFVHYRQDFQSYDDNYSSTFTALSHVHYDISSTIDDMGYGRLSQITKDHIKTFTMTIHNIGMFAAANNIIAQFNSTHFRFINFTSMPFLSKTLKGCTS